MAVLENWGTAGTAGDGNWGFSGTYSVLEIGTHNGTPVLDINDGGTVLYPYRVEYDTGSFYARIYSNYGTGGGLNTLNRNQYLLARNSGGTELWCGLQMWSSYFGWFFERYKLTENTIDSAQIAVASSGSWFEISVTESSGTLYGTISGGGTSIPIVAAGWEFSGVMRPRIEDTSYVLGSSHIDIVDWPFSRTTILDFTGTYNDGSDTGTYNLGDDVLTMSGVTELGFMPYMNAGWAATIPVSIDDSTGAWAGLAGSMNNPTFLDGTYTIRHKWGDTWHILKTCYAEAEDIKYDYGKKIANVTLHDILGKRADEALPLAGTLATDLCENLELGTVIAVDNDNRTFTFKNNLQDYTTNSGPWYGEKDILWNSTGSMGSRINVGSALDYDQYGAGTWLDVGGGWKNGSIALSGTVPDWIAADAVLRITMRFPTRGQIVNYASYNTSDWFDLVLEAWGFDDVSGSERKPMNYYDLKAAKVYHPGDKYKDILNDMCICCQTSYSLDGSGAMSFYTDGIFSGSNYGTFDFNSLPLNNNWTVSYISATKQVRIKAAWDNEDRKYTVEYLSEEGTFESGQTLSLECPWLRDDVNAEYLADRIAFFRNVTRIALSFEIAGSEWLNYSPRYQYTIANLPSDVLVPSSIFRLMGKTYQLNGYTALTFESEKPGTSWFTWNQSKWDGTDVWW